MACAKIREKIVDGFVEGDIFAPETIEWPFTAIKCDRWLSYY